MNLVTVEQARCHLRIDDDDPVHPDNIWLDIMIPAISQAVLLWLKDNGKALVSQDDEHTPPVVKPVVQAAVLVELAVQYRFREGDGNTAVPAHWGHGYTLSTGASALLTPLRKPSLA